MSENGHTPGFQMPARVLVLEFPPDSPYAGALVRCHRTISLHRALALKRLMADEEAADEEAAVDLFARELLIGWNLLDEDGAALPCTPEQFADQPVDFVTVILNQWVEQAFGVSGPLAAASPAGSPSAAVGTMPAA